MAIDLDNHVLEAATAVMKAADTLLDEGHHLSEKQRAFMQILCDSADLFTRVYESYLTEFLPSEYAKIPHSHSVTIAELRSGWATPVGFSHFIQQEGLDLWSDTQRDIFEQMQRQIAFIRDRLDEARETLRKQL